MDARGSGGNWIRRVRSTTWGRGGRARRGGSALAAEAARPADPGDQRRGVAVGLWLAPKSYTATATVDRREGPDRRHAARGARRAAGHVSPRWRPLATSSLAVQDRLARAGPQPAVGPVAVHPAASGSRARSWCGSPPRTLTREVAADIANLVAAELDEAPPASEAFDFTVTSSPAEPPRAVLRARTCDWSSPLGALAACSSLPSSRCCGTGGPTPWTTRRRPRRPRSRRCSRISPRPGTPPRCRPSSPGQPRRTGSGTCGWPWRPRPALGGSSKVVVAGVTAGDSTVWLAANVAIALAGVGRRVLLVDGRMGERFGRPVEEEPDTPGLYDVLSGAPSRRP